MNWYILMRKGTLSIWSDVETARYKYEYDHKHNYNHDDPWTVVKSPRNVIHSKVYVNLCTWSNRMRSSTSWIVNRWTDRIKVNKNPTGKEDDDEQEEKKRRTASERERERTKIERNESLYLLSFFLLFSFDVDHCLCMHNVDPA